MSHVLAGACGVLAGLIIAVPLRRALIRYSEHSLPEPPYAGPRVVRWEDAEVRARTWTNPTV